MAVSASYAPLPYAWTTSNQAFPVTWPFFTGTLRVVHIDDDGAETIKTPSTHYTVSGGTDADGLPSTGTVTMVGSSGGGTIRIERVTPKTQTHEWTQNDPFPAKVMEQALDRLILIAQETVDGGLDWVGAWKTATDYEAGDVVASDGSSYVCISAHTSAATSRPDTGADWEDHWAILASVGADGVSPVWHAASGAPDNVLGSNGDMYLDTNSGEVYGPKANGAWGGAIADITGPAGDGSGDMLKSENLSGLANVATARSNLGLGTAATADAGDFAAADHNHDTRYYTEQEADSLIAAAAISPPQGRLTLSSTEPVPTSDANGASTVYYLPYVGQRVPVYDGSAWGMHDIGASGLSMALRSTQSGTNPHAADNNYDIFAALDDSTLRIGTGPAWSNSGAGSSARGTGAGTTEIERVDGLWVNAEDITLRHGSSSGDTFAVSANQATYLGTMRCSANGQVSMRLQPNAAAGGGNCDIGLWNAYNQVPTPALSRESANSWEYNASTWRPSNNSTSNRVSIVIGLPTRCLAISTTTVEGFMDPGQGSGFAGVGVNSTSSPSGLYTMGGGKTVALEDTSVIATAIGRVDQVMDAGHHYFQALERAVTNVGGETLFYGDADGMQNGLTAEVMA